MILPPNDGPRYARNMYRLTKYTKNNLCSKLVFLYMIIKEGGLSCVQFAFIDHQRQGVISANQIFMVFEIFMFVVLYFVSAVKLILEIKLPVPV